MIEKIESLEGIIIDVDDPMENNTFNVRIFNKLKETIEVVNELVEVNANGLTEIRERKKGPKIRCYTHEYEANETRLCPECGEKLT